MYKCNDCENELKEISRYHVMYDDIKKIKIGMQCPEHDHRTYYIIIEDEKEK